MLILIAEAIATYALFTARRIRRTAVLFLLLIADIIVSLPHNPPRDLAPHTAPQMIIPIYQLVILRDTTTDLLSRARGSQNTPEEKVFFYVLQVVPEFTCICAVLSINTRRMFGTEMWGDHDVSGVRRLFARWRAPR